MHLISAVVRNYRVHRQISVQFDRARNVVGGPNETGKSTLIEAIHRALFLRSKAGGEVQKAMVSNLPGVSGHPEVEVAFHAGGRDYHLSKRFSGGQTGVTKLTEAGGETWTGDDGEERLAALLGLDSLVGGQGAANKLAQQWAHLWVWQGKSGEDPCAHAGSEHATLLQRLQETGGAAAMQSECDSRVAAEFAQLSGGIFGQKAQPKKGSDLEKAQAALGEAEAVRDRARERVERLRQAVAAFEQAAGIIAGATEDLRSLEADRAAVKAKLARVEKLGNVERAQQVEASGAADKYRGLKKADDQIAELRAKIAACETSLAPKNTELARAETTVGTARETAEQAERTYLAAGEETRTARLRRDLAAAFLQWIERKTTVDQLAAKLAQIQSRGEGLARLRKDVAALPEIDGRKLKKLQALESEAQQATAALRAMAAGIEVLATDQTVRVGAANLGIGESETVTETTEIAIGDSVRLRIRPGGGERLAEARSAAAEAGRKLQSSLDAIGVEDVAAAAETVARRTDLQNRIGQEERILEEMEAKKLPAQLAAARQEEAMVRADVERRRERIREVTEPADHATARSHLGDEEEALRLAERMEAECRSARDSAQKALKEAEQERTRIGQSLETETAALRGFEAQHRLLLENHGNDEIRAKALAEADAARRVAERELAETRAALAELQPELLQGDRVRLHRAWEEANRRLEEAKIRQAEAKVELRSDGGEDPQGDWTLAEARVESARQRLEGVRVKAEAIRLLDTLFTEEQQAMADHFTAPLVERISGYLQCLFGPGARAAVTLGDGAFTGMQLIRPGHGAGAVAFDSLSGGAREQVAAAVRLAMAEVLAGDHGGCLPVVFDDAFAYSDSERVKTLQRMLDLAANRGLQVIVLTCAPSDYAGLGARHVTLAPDPSVPDLAETAAN